MPAQDTLSILQRISRAYPEKHLSKATLQIYQEELGDIPSGLLDKAVSHLLRNSPWLPRISDVRQTAVQIAGTANFASLTESGVDSLVLEAVKLENEYFHEGQFNLQAWEGLADQFQRLGRFFQADEIRRKAQHIQANELALQRGEEYPPREERMRYATWDNNSGDLKE